MFIFWKYTTTKDFLWNFQIGGSLPSGRLEEPAVGWLRITDVQAADSGIYQCTASNQLHTISAQAQLIVLGKMYAYLTPTYSHSVKIKKRCCFPLAQLSTAAEVKNLFVIIHNGTLNNSEWFVNYDFSLYEIDCDVEDLIRLHVCMRSTKEHPI